MVFVSIFPFLGEGQLWVTQTHRWELTVISFNSKSFAGDQGAGFSKDTTSLRRNDQSRKEAKSSKCRLKTHHFSLSPGLCCGPFSLVCKLKTVVHLSHAEIQPEKSHRTVCSVAFVLSTSRRKVSPKPEAHTLWDFERNV